MNRIEEIRRINERELQLGIKFEASWHQKYRASAWIFIGGLPYEYTEGDVLCVFSQCGEIEDINLVREKDTGKSRGFAFLKFEDFRSTVLAVDNFNGSTLGGRRVHVDHVEKYKLPKDVREREEELEKDGGKYGEVRTRGLPGHAYEGKELASDFTIKKGVDLFSRPEEEEEEDEEQAASDRSDVEGRKRKRQKKEKKEKKAKKEKKKHKTKESRRSRDRGSDEERKRRSLDRSYDDNRRRERSREREEDDHRRQRDQRQDSVSSPSATTAAKQREEPHRLAPTVPSSGGPTGAPAAASWRGRLEPSAAPPAFSFSKGANFARGTRPAGEEEKKASTGSGGSALRSIEGIAGQSRAR